MNTLISAIDGASIASGFAALILIALRRHKITSWYFGFVLIMLIVIQILFVTAFLLAEWVNLSSIPLKPEDVHTFGILLPFGWAFLFYAMTQETIRAESETRETALNREILERRLAEQEIRQRNIEINNIIENVNAAILMLTAERKIKFVNRMFCRMFSIPRAPNQLKGLKSLQFALEATKLLKNPDVFLADIEEATSSGKLADAELLETVDGRFLERDYRPIADNGKLLYHLWVYQDVTSKIIATKAIEKAAQEWQTTFNSIAEMIAITDDEHIIARANKAFANFLGINPEEIPGQNACYLITGNKKTSDDCPCLIAQRTRKPASKEFFYEKKNTDLEVTAFPIINPDNTVSGSVLIIRDITESKMVQQQLILQDRLASIGELAGGVAHELNNPLTGVIGFSDILLQEEPAGEKRELLELIRNDARRTVAIVKDLMIFAREQTGQKLPLSVNEIIQRVIALRVYPLKMKNITVKADLTENLPPVMGNSARLHQVVSNLIQNAEQAMDGKNEEHIIEIKTEKHGSGVRIIFADNGRGIEKSIKSKIFNPFFTTRDVGQGTGLGLSISHHIVSDHGGSITVKSKPGDGSAFTIDLPGIQ